ncbi:MAG: hypothetical protein M3Y54_15625 [Bacteroidota bacterium]|nr:hypothetical protein [Bacteroidota bacterium]
MVYTSHWRLPKIRESIGITVPRTENHLVEQNRLPSYVALSRCFGSAVLSNELFKNILPFSVFIVMPEESTLAKEQPTVKEQTPQAMLTAALAVYAGVLFKDPAIKGAAVASTPFVSIVVFWLLRVGAKEWRDWRESTKVRREFDAYLATINKRLQSLPPNAPERAELEADATAVRRMRHEGIMRQLVAYSQPLSSPSPHPAATPPPEAAV